MQLRSSCFEWEKSSWVYKYTKTQNWKHYWRDFHSKRKNLHSHNEWLNKHALKLLGMVQNARKLGSILTEAQKCWTSMLHMWNAACQTYPKGCLHRMVNDDEKLTLYDNSQKRKSWNARSSTVMRKTRAAYLVGSGWSRVLWVARTKRNHYFIQRNWWVTTYLEELKIP